MSRRRGGAAAGGGSGKVRIIAGQWRGSRLDVPQVEGLRPSPDRVRETLFNWLQGRVAGAACIDLFAGTGALGFEAASRGAASVLMLERDARALAGLHATAGRLGADAVEIVPGDALEWLGRAPDRRFDLAFVDPPFAAGLQQRALDALLPWLAPEAWIHVECGREQALPAAPGFGLWREGRTHLTRFCLLRRTTGIPWPDAPVTLAPSHDADFTDRT